MPKKHISDIFNYSLSAKLVRGYLVIYSNLERSASLYYYDSIFSQLIKHPRDKILKHFNKSYIYKVLYVIKDPFNVAESAILDIFHKAALFIKERFNIYVGASRLWDYTTSVQDILRPEPIIGAGILLLSAIVTNTVISVVSGSYIGFFGWMARVVFFTLALGLVSCGSNTDSIKGSSIFLNLFHISRRI
jgi:hypothetical protein